MSCFKGLFSDDPKKEQAKSPPKEKEADRGFKYQLTNAGNLIKVYDDGRVVFVAQEEIAREALRHDKLLREINIERHRQGLNGYSTLEEAMKGLYEIPREYTNY